ncbi:hypothetical protein [Lysobacter niastensis]|uniref:Uncharacterized protein n=1 Tax=Lysobacter niastensis TaxID=380629 RepID=A0ABS0B8K7_9GAMM|nr:hypothetical protein [Lysobacter niastensis]MBF6024042.1 hypothetical protein [Lysobacter niastensis]
MGTVAAPICMGTASANRATWANATMPKSEAATLQKAGLDIPLLRYLKTLAAYRLKKERESASA